PGAQGRQPPAEEPAEARSAAESRRRGALLATADPVAMAEQFLSQDEIDALLDATETGEAPAASAAAQPEAQPYDLARQERIVRGRMPALELIHERFSRNLRIGLFNFMRRNPEVTIEPVVVGKYSTFIGSLAVPSN